MKNFKSEQCENFKMREHKFTLWGGRQGGGSPGDRGAGARETGGREGYGRREGRGREAGVVRGREAGDPVHKAL